MLARQRGVKMRRLCIRYVLTAVDIVGGQMACERSLKVAKIVRGVLLERSISDMERVQLEMK